MGCGAHAGLAGEAAGEVVIDDEIVDVLQERIDSGIARNMNRLRIDVLSQKIPASSLGGGEVNTSKPPGNHSIHLFRKRLRKIARPQPRFHVRDRNVQLDRGEGARQGGIGGSRLP